MPYMNSSLKTIHSDRFNGGAVVSHCFYFPLTMKEI
jgi:hypothetical protein